MYAVVLVQYVGKNGFMLYVTTGFADFLLLEIHDFAVHSE